MTTILLLAAVALLSIPVWIVPVVSLIVKLSYTPPATFSASTTDQLTGGASNA
jgi:hypothetical protein